MLDFDKTPVEWQLSVIISDVRDANDTQINMAPVFTNDISMTVNQAMKIVENLCKSWCGFFLTSDPDISVHMLKEDGKYEGHIYVYVKGIIEYVG